MYLGEARERGIAVLAPDINESQLHFSVEKRADGSRPVRFGLTAIKGLGEGAVNAILAARDELGGRIPSLHTLCETLDLRLVNKRVFEALVKSGACDSLVLAAAPAAGGTGAAPRPLRDLRARLLAAVDGACEHGARMQRNKDLGQVDLFGEALPSAASVALPDAAPWTEIEQLNFEKESLGLYWSGHPIDRFADDLRAYGARATADLLPKPDPDGAPQVEIDDLTPQGIATPPPTGAVPRAVAEELSIGGIV